MKDRLDFKKIFRNLIIIGLLSLIVTLMNFYFSTAELDKVYFKTHILSKKTLLLNFLPIFIIMLVIYILSDRMWLANLLTSLLIFGMGSGNKHKLMYRDEPFTFMDIKLIEEASKMAGQYEIKITPLMFIMVVYIGLSSYVLYKIRKKEKHVIRKTITFKLIAFISLFLFSSFLLNKVYFNPDLYEKVGNKEIINIWNQSEQFQSKGFIYPFIYSYRDSKDIEPDGYNEEVAREILDKYKSKDIPEEKKVHFISIMLEAYNDFSKFEEVELNEELDVYKNFHKIQENSYYGDLITNVFGGGTINTELSYLTWYNSHPKYVISRNASPWYFRTQGYYAEFMHPFYEWFYNRKNLVNYIGFENFDSYENKYKDIQEDFLDDIDFFDYIIEGYESAKKDGKYYFHHSTTYQNHGPYNENGTVDTEYLVKKDKYTEGEYNIINNYLDGIYRTDQALKKLTDYLEKDDEPVILILFGDHNPWLGDANSGYEMLGIDLNMETVEGFKNYYTTPYLFWANDAAKKVLDKDFKEKGEDISPNFLMAELFDYIGYSGDSYMQYVLDLKTYFSVNNDVRFKTPNGYEDLDDEAMKKWKEFNWVQYYYSRNFIYDEIE